MENNYYQKYLKYKSKYLELKKLGGGLNCTRGVGQSIESVSSCKTCCTGYNNPGTQEDCDLNCVMRCAKLPKDKCDKCCEQTAPTQRVGTCKELCNVCVTNPDDNMCNQNYN